MELGHSQSGVGKSWAAPVDPVQAELIEWVGSVEVVDVNVPGCDGQSQLGWCCNWSCLGHLGPQTELGPRKSGSSKS